MEEIDPRAFNNGAEDLGLMSMMVPTPSYIPHQRRQENLYRTCIFGFTS